MQKDFVRTYPVFAFTSTIILLNLGAVTLAAEAVCNKKDVAKNLIAELKDNLFCGYDADIHPTKNESKPLEVMTDLMITRVETGDEAAGRVYIHAWMLLYWIDEHLKWKNDSKYGEIKYFVVPSDKIWRPNIILVTSDFTYSSKETDATCTVRFTGEVICFTRDIFIIECLVNHKYWPLGTMNCTMIFSAWTQSHRINLTHVSDDPYIGIIGPDMHERHHHWQLVHWQKDNIIIDGQMNKTFPSVSFNLILNRYTTTKFILVTGPIMVTVFLMLMSYALEAASTERIVILVTSLLCHFVCILQFMHYISVNGESCPVIVLFVRGSTILTILAILQTLILGQVDRLTCNSLEIFEKILKSAFGRIITYGGGHKDTILCGSTEDLNNVKNWQFEVLFLNRLFLMVATFVYCGLFIVFFI